MKHSSAHQTASGSMSSEPIQLSTGSTSAVSLLLTLAHSKRAIVVGIARALASAAWETLIASRTCCNDASRKRSRIRRGYTVSSKTAQDNAGV